MKDSISTSTMILCHQFMKDLRTREIDFELKPHHVYCQAWMCQLHERLNTTI